MMSLAVAKDRVAIMRAAFDDTVKDPAFVAEAEKLRLPVSPKNGDTALKVVEVGSFVASFVPSASDFSRLDPRFRLAPGIVDALGVGDRRTELGGDVAGGELDRDVGARRLADGDTGTVSLPRIVAIRSSDAFHGDDWIGLKMRDASVVRGIGVLPMFAGLLGLLLLVGSLALTWAREGR